MRFDDGDVLKLIPLCHNDGSKSFMVKTNFFYNNVRMVYDTGDMLNRAYFISRKREDKKGTFGVVHLCGAEKMDTGQIGIVKLGNTLFGKVMEQYDTNRWDLYPNLHIRKTNTGTPYPSFDKSYMTYTLPNISYEPTSDVIDPAKWQSLNIDDFISKYGIERHWHVVDSETGGLLSEIKREMREKQLEELGI